MDTRPAGQPQRKGTDDFKGAGGLRLGRCRSRGILLCRLGDYTSLFKAYITASFKDIFCPISFKPVNAASPSRSLIALVSLS